LTRIHVLVATSFGQSTKYAFDLLKNAVMSRLVFNCTATVIILQVELCERFGQREK